MTVESAQITDADATRPFAAADGRGTPSVDESRSAAAFADHWLAIRRHAWRMVRDETTAEDLTQEAFLRLCAADRLGRWPDTPQAWLTTVVTNLAVSGFRRASVARRRADALNRTAACLAESTFAIAVFDDIEFRTDAGPAVATALEGLAAEQRRAVLLAGAGYSASEIGREIGRTPGAVRTLLCRARRTLRSALLDAAVTS